MVNYLQTWTTCKFFFEISALEKLKLILNGKIQDEQGSYGGTYLLQEGKTNEKNYWIHQSKDSAIWWDKVNDKWNIGTPKNLGSSTSAIKGPFNNDSLPSLINEGWKYWDGSDWQKSEENDVKEEDKMSNVEKLLKDTECLKPLINK